MKQRLLSAAGLDISEHQISLALLRSEHKGVKLVRSARVPMPKGVVDQGRVVEPALLCKALAELKRRCAVKADETVISLFVEPSLIQMIEIPEALSISMGQFVKKEIKQYVTLPGEVASDYCGLVGASGVDRVFAVAADSDGVDQLVNACQKARFNLEAVEPALLGYARVLYGNRMTYKFGRNTVLVILRDHRMTLCIFREQKIDFVRTSPVAPEEDPSDALGRRLKEEIESVIQFYELEVLHNDRPWDVDMVIDSGMTLSDASQTYLKETIGRTSLAFFTPEKIAQTMPLETSRSVVLEQTSMVAVGHAMRLLQDDPAVPSLNLLPQRVLEVKKAKRHAMIASIAAATVFFLMGVMVITLLLAVDRHLDHIARTQPMGEVGDMVEMASRKREIESEIEQIARVPKWTKQVMNAKTQVNWGGFLADMKDMIPTSMCITKLLDAQDQTLVVEGLAQTYESITVFTGRLKASQYVVSAEWKGTDQRTRPYGYIPYKIVCQLKAEPGL